MSNQRELHGLAAILRVGAQVLFGAGLLLVTGSLSVHAQVSVTTWHNDIARTGQNLNETILNTSNVNSTQFGKLFSQPVDGYVYAQPLYLPNLTIGGASHNVVFIATEHDSVYAFDADSNTGPNANPLWSAPLLTTAHGAAAGATTIATTSDSDITPEVGITGTPVIDPASGTLYVVSSTMEGVNTVQRLHALDVTSGAEKFGGPAVITATISGAGNGSVNGTLTFDPELENQRPGLLLLNGIVYIAFASYGDAGPFHGWILAYNASTLKQTGTFCVSPSGTDGGIWMGGAALAAEVNDPAGHPFGRMFVATANGDFTAAKPYTASMDFGDTILNLDLTSGFPTVQDSFTPSIQASEDSGDDDQGAGGLLILPNQSGANPHLLVQAGKTGEVYLLNRENLGGYHTSGDQVVQGITFAVGNVGTWTMPAYWNGNIYYWSVNDNLKVFPLVNGQLTGPTIFSSETYGYPGANPSISANGNTQGIVWTIERGTPAVLQAHNASSSTATLYSSSTNASRDNPGSGVKFTVPTVVNGKVYVGAQMQFSVFGLLGAQQTTASPQLSPSAESFTGSLSVTITDATSGATIYYTLDGTTPTVSSKIYTGPITIKATTTIQAMASASGFLQSSVTSDTYVLSSQASPPTFSPGGGAYSSSQTVTISDTTSGATMYYTTNGTTPTTSSTKYTGPITVSATETIEAIAVASGFSNSSVTTATYTITSGSTTYINYPASGFTASALALDNGATVTGGLLQLTDGKTGEGRTAWFSSKVPVQSFITDFTFQQLNASADGMTFTIQGNSIWALGYSGSGLGYQSIPKSVAVKFDLYNNAGEGPDSTGIYTNGAAPTTPAINLSSTGINLHSGDTMHAHMVYDGTNLTMTLTDTVTNASVTEVFPVNIPGTVGGSTAFVGFTGGTGSTSATQNVLSWSYVSPATSASAAAPSFSPGGGAYSTSQSVTISDATSEATIYYTTNGTTPTTSSTKYTGPITVSSTETLEAIAVASGFNNSSVTTATYTITSGSSTYINYPASGFTASALALDNGAAVTGGLLQLTDGKTGEERTAWYSSKVPVQNFITDFTFQQLNATADGMTFTIQGGSIWALGYSGAGLGYQSIPNSVAVKFDLYNNAGEGPDSTGIYTNGAAPTTPAINLSSTGINLHSGDTMHAHMVYDGTNLTMTLTDTVTNATVTEVFPVNIPGTVGGSTAFVGFTGGTGGSSATQNVLSWTYGSN